MKSPTLYEVLILLLFLHKSHETLVNISDPNWYFTEWNWYIDPSGEFASTSNPASYFKVAFTGTSVTLNLNLTSCMPNDFMVLRFSVDYQPYKEVTINQSSANTISLAASLVSGNHYAILYIRAASQFDNRWVLSGQENRLYVTGLTIDEGATTLPPTLRPKRVMVYWDSIGEGVRVLGTSDISWWNDLVDNDGTSTWAMALATALNAEISVVAFGGQGYTNSGVGGIPPLITPGDETMTAWDKFDSEHYRFHANQTATNQPDMIFCGHGTNDQDSSPQEVTARALAWLISMRSVATKSTIFLVVPFGGFQEAAVMNAFEEYTSQYKDPNVFFINLGEEATIGLNGQGPSLYSVDGAHPLYYRTGQLGALLYEGAVSSGAFS